ncbi:MAG: TIGR01212 family radical SAM protein [Clostridia bacterium]|nr:TIGR01212 family radical SAM protein [Clostridia bacterium]
MRTTADYCREVFGEKLYKLNLNAGCTCPNRDGTIGTGGCVFCSAGGSGEFAAEPGLSVSEQIDRAKAQVEKKFRGDRYIAYFQAYTNTYAPVPVLRDRFFAAAEREDIACVSIATRPDCLEPEKLALLAELNRVKPVWVELGLQTSNEETARRIRRGFPDSVYADAVRSLNGLGIHVITHVILGLPGETKEDMTETVRYVVRCGSGGIKLQLLQILKGTDLEREYREGKVSVLSEDEYLRILVSCLSLLPDNTVVHRMTGDPPRDLLIAPLWCLRKKRILNRIRALLQDSPDAVFARDSAPSEGRL